MGPTCGSDMAAKRTASGMAVVGFSPDSVLRESTSSSADSIAGSSVLRVSNREEMGAWWEATPDDDDDVRWWW